MTLSSNGQSFILEISRRALFIHAGQYEFSWDSNGYCLCKGMKTLWANWE
jgi:hypothetical protein